MRHETRNKRHETRDKRQGTRDKRQGTRDMEQEKGDKGAKDVSIYLKKTHIAFALYSLWFIYNYLNYTRRLVR